VKSFLVYLAGPITGLSFVGATDWRRDAAIAIGERSEGRVETLSPMRHKDYLSGVEKIADSYEGSVLSSQRGIFYRDRLDCTRADLVLVNMLGASRVFIGTVMEIAWANAREIPIVLVMEDGNLHEHSMLREACGFRVQTMPEAIDVALRILMPDDWRQMAKTGAFA